MSTSVRRRVAAIAAFLVSLTSFGYAFALVAPVALATVTPVTDGPQFPNYNQPGGICPDGQDGWSGHINEDDPQGGDWGEAEWLAGDGHVLITVNEGYEVLVCTKGGRGRTIYLVTAGEDQVVPAPAGVGLSHWSYKINATPPPTTTTTAAPTTTTTAAPTTTTTLPSPPGPSCPPPPDGSIVIPIEDPSALRLTTRSWAAGHKEIGGVVVLPGGTYLVSLGSYDPRHYPVPPGDTASQPREEWLLEFWTGEARIAESPATPDLADDEWFAYYPDIGTVTLTDDVTRVFARHNLWGAGSATDPAGAGVLEAAPTVNSIDPACAYLTPVPPQPGRIIVVKQFSADGETIGALPSGVTSPSFGFTPSWGAGFGLKIGESNDSGNLAAGAYSVAESPTEIVEGGWKWLLVPGLTSCSDGSPVSAIVVSEGETVTCTFVNTRVEVGGIQVTTTTTAPTTTTTAAVAPSTLPFTGPTDGSLVPIGIAFAVIGLLLLAASYRKEEGQVI